ncbi:MAG: choice-of-anchor D domain-containing protein, partial [Bacteroidota bacterium]
DFDLYVGERYGAVREFLNISPSDILLEADGSEITNNGSLNFGNVDLGSTGDTTVIVRNAGLSNLILNQAVPFSVSGDITQFNVLPQGGIPSDFTIAPGDSLVFTVSFTPNSVGGKNLAVTFNTNDPDEAAFTLNVGGTGIDPASTEPEADVLQNTVNITSNSTFDFGDIDTQNGSDTTFIIRNNGAVDLTLAPPSLSGSAAFSLSGNFPAGPIAAGQEATFTINFMPTDTTTQMAMLSFATNDADENPYIINLLGKGAPTTSIFELLDGELSIGPVPAQNNLRIGLKNSNARDYQVRFFDRQGRTVVDEQVELMQREEVRELDVSQLSPGLYFVEILIQGQRLIKKIVIE